MKPNEISLDQRLNPTPQETPMILWNHASCFPMRLTWNAQSLNDRTNRPVQSPSMRNQPQHHVLTTAIAVISLSIATFPLAGAASLITQLATSTNLGLSGMSTEPWGNGLSTISPTKGVISTAIGLASQYDSNFFLDEHHPRDEFTTMLSPKIHYSSDPEGGAPITINADYEANARFYAENSDLDGVNHRGGLMAKIEGTRSAITAEAQYRSTAATDSLTGTFVTTGLTSVRLLGTYQVAPKTSFYLGLSNDSSTYDSAGFVSYQTMSGQTGFFWSADERFSMGPSLSYSSMQSDNTGNHDTGTVSIQTLYKLAESVQILASIGMNQAINEAEFSNRHAGLTGYLAAYYEINPLWTWESSLQHVTTPSATQSDYLVNDLSVSTRIMRKFTASTASLGVLFEMQSYEALMDFPNALVDDSRSEIFIGYQKPIFNGRAEIKSNARYGLNHGNTEWEQFQLTAEISVNF